MGRFTSVVLIDRLPGLRRLMRIPSQLIGRCPFQGDYTTSAIPLFAPGSGRPSLPFPHPWNYHDPIRILETYFWNAEQEQGSRRHSRYLQVPGFDPVLITRDPELIRAITIDTGDQPGQFDRDTLPSTGIARATGKDSLLYANGAEWRKQKKLAMPPFGKTSLYQPEQFSEFEETFRHTIRQRLDVLEQHLQNKAEPVQVALEPEIKAIMLEMLTNNFFGASIEYDLIRNEFVPALEHVIEHIVRDTVLNKLDIPVKRLPALSKRGVLTKESYRKFEQLTDLVLEARDDSKGLWGQFRSDAPNHLIRSNIRVFLAGALEATTSFASWTISHLARSPQVQEEVHAEVARIERYTSEALANATQLSNVMEETLRLTPSLYFLPRRATANKSVEMQNKQKLVVPKGTHILLDVWHANRHEDHWGVEQTGYPADKFQPDRWNNIRAETNSAKRFLHFGFGHGPRICPGTHLGKLEVALVVGALVKLFRFKATSPTCGVIAGVSTKPADGTIVELAKRDF